MRHQTLSEDLRFKGVAALLACVSPLAAQAQTTEAEADSLTLGDETRRQVRRDRQVQVGVVAAYTPIFLGSKDYQLIAAPMIQARYDRFFLSFPEGLGYDVVQSKGWRAGPLIGFRGPRRENGGGPFQITGGTDALRGLGTIKATADVGGYLAYVAGNVSARIDVRQAVSQDAGLIATISARYNARLPVGPGSGRAPATVSIGPRLSLVNDTYSQTYFGVTDIQSARSGLVRYNADGGLLSVGIGANALVPLTDRISATVVAGYDRLAGDAARSPLVEERGSRNQATVGLGLTYKFGL